MELLFHDFMIFEFFKKIRNTVLVNAKCHSSRINKTDNTELKQKPRFQGRFKFMKVFVEF